MCVNECDVVFIAFASLDRTCSLRLSFLFNFLIFFVHSRYFSQTLRTSYFFSFFVVVCAFRFSLLPLLFFLLFASVFLLVYPLLMPSALYFTYPLHPVVYFNFFSHYTFSANLVSSLKGLAILPFCFFLHYTPYPSRGFPFPSPVIPYKFSSSQ